MRSTVTLEDRIRGLTRERRQTQDDVAAALGIHRTTLVRKLNGSSDFTVSEMLKLSAHFSVPVSSLYGETTDSASATPADADAGAPDPSHGAPAPSDGISA